MSTKSNRKHCERGQALLMLTFSLVAMIGALALAVDLGWSHFIKQKAQAAADAAAAGGALHALAAVGNGRFVCGTNAICQATAPCPSSLSSPAANSVESACAYARENGFEVAAGGRQNVTVAADITSPPPTAPGVNDISYWITVRTTETVPLLFSSIMGYRQQFTTARATAVITQGVQVGSLYLLNRQNDVTPVGTGVNLTAGGNPTVAAPGGILMASTANGSSGSYAASLNGTPTITAPFTHIRGAGAVEMVGNASWVQTPQNGFADGADFKDPMSARGQPPPVPPGGIGNYVPVRDGCLDCLPQPLLPGQYYAVDCNGVATGARLNGRGNITFSSGGSSFGNYVFYGGIEFPSPHTTATFSPGRYVFAGVQAGGDILSYHTGVTLTDNSMAGQPNTDAGEIFIFTDANYPGLSGNIPPAVQAIRDSLGFGPVNLHAGNNPSVGVNLHGLNRSSPQVPAELLDFAPTVFWQDQRNSRVKYDAEGNVDYTSCGGGHSLDNPCANAALANSDTPGMRLQAHPNVSLYGSVYQPRGAWLTLQGNGSISSPLVFITGAVSLQGGADLLMLDNRDQLRRRIVALVE